MRRLLVAAATVTALAVPATLVSAAVTSGVASAQTPPACKKLSGTISGTFTLKKCKPASKQNKSASGESSSLATGGGTITWAPSGGTTTVSISFSQASDNTGCKSGSTKYDVSGSVTGGSSTYTASGQSVSAEACVTNSGKLSLAKKTEMDL